MLSSSARLLALGLFVASAMFVGAADPESEHPLVFIHPGIAHTLEDIQFVRGKIIAANQPWADAWNTMTQSRYADLTWKAEPFAHVERGPSNNPNIGSSEFSRDATAAYTHALMWSLGGDESHALKSAEIIDAWSLTLKSIRNHDAKLLLGMEGQEFCNAAELLRHTWDGWPETNQASFKQMLREIWYPVIENFHPSANGNWDASILQTMIAMGVFLDDQEIFDRAVDYFRHGEGNGAIGNYFNDFGQCQESGRDQVHTQMGLDYLATTCETAWHQGVDLYGELDNRLLKGFEYTAKYNLGFDVPYEPYRSFEGRYFYKQISSGTRGRLRPMYEKVLRHYVHRRKLEAKYTVGAVAKLRQTGEEEDKLQGRSKQERSQDQSDRRQRRGTLGSLPWDTLMYATGEF